MTARNTTPVACGHAERRPGCNECEPDESPADGAKPGIAAELRAQADATDYMHPGQMVSFTTAALRKIAAQIDRITPEPSEQCDCVARHVLHEKTCRTLTKRTEHG